MHGEIKAKLPICSSNQSVQRLGLNLSPRDPPPLRSSRTDWASRPGIALRINATLELDVALCIVLAAIIATKCLSTSERVAELVVLGAPSDYIIDAATNVRRALHSLCRFFSRLAILHVKERWILEDHNLRVATDGQRLQENNQNLRKATYTYVYRSSCTFCPTDEEK